MMSLGPIAFAQPLALIALVALPIIWWLLRATPPEPQRQELPSLALLDEIVPREETPDKTPWWIIALRFAAAALAILGFARPSWQPEMKIEASAGPVLIVVDDGWTSAPRWREIIRTANSVIEDASDEQRGVQLVFTAPQAIAPAPAEFQQGGEARRRLQSQRVSPWAPDRMAALEQINAETAAPARVVWITDGMDHGAAAQFTNALSDIAQLEVRPLPPLGGYAISSARFSPEGALVEIQRPGNRGEGAVTVTAETTSGAAIASVETSFADGGFAVQAAFRLPAVALNQVARFRILGQESAGAVWLWDDASQAPTVALADPVDSPQPLLEEFYYVRKALEGEARVMEGPLAEMIDARPDAIILGDRNDLTAEQTSDLDAWINEGGALIRFAGPFLAGGADDTFTPVPLRRAARALGGALAWDEPQNIASFPSNSPFTGLAPPQDAQVRRQVLAQPTTDLDRYTWARLADGTPLVTAAPQGRGMLILFHVTANTDWSDLPLYGAFPQMLKRAAISGAVGGARRTDTAGSLAPVRVLNGKGALTPPPATAKPIASDDFADTVASPESLPGIYAGPQGTRALNVGAVIPDRIITWPADVSVVQDVAETSRRGLDGWLLGGALTLLLFDALVALAVAGRLPRLFGRAAALVLTASVLGVAAPDLQAQELSEKAREAALELRFAYVETGDRRRDDAARAGLTGLSYQLYRRTSVEPGDPHGVKLGVDPLDLYPMIYFAPPLNAAPLSDTEIEALNNYMRSGGALVIDTADATPGIEPGGRLREIMTGLNAPPLQPTPDNHVMTRSFYLIDDFPGRLGVSPVWIETASLSGETRRGDGVSGLFIGSVDWAGAWAVDEDFRPMFPMEDSRQREMAYRFGVNLVMYVLTGNYKEDQVHLPALLERLDEEEPAPRSRDGRVDRIPGGATDERPSMPEILERLEEIE